MQQILKKHVPDARVLAFGSRVLGKARRFSDLDLAVFLPTGMTLRDQGRLRHAFEESDLVIRVDIGDGTLYSPSFRAIVEAQGIVVQEGGSGLKTGT